MQGAAILEAAIQAVEAGDFDRARSLLADDFTFSGAVPEPIGPDAWLGIHRAFAAAMPDFSFNLSGVRESGAKVLAQLQLTGTQTHELALPIPGVKPVPPTGKHVSLPAEDIAVTTAGDKITNLDVSPVEGGGVAGLLSQLGVTVPVHQ